MLCLYEFNSLNVMFMDPWIVVCRSRNNQQDTTLY